MNQNQRDTTVRGSREITVGNLLRLLLSRAHWLLLSGLAAALVVLFIVSVLISPTYESRASFYVYNNAGGASSGTISNSDLLASSSLAETYSKILESDSVFSAVLDDLGNSRQITKSDLGQMVHVSVVSGTQLIKVTVSSTDAEFSCEVANAFVRVAPAEIVRITKAGSVEVVDRPSVATQKSAPRTLFDTVIGAVIGVIAASVVIILRTLANRTVYLPEDIENTAVLGEVPVIDGQEDSHAYWKIIEGRSDRHEAIAVSQGSPDRQP